MVRGFSRAARAFARAHQDNQKKKQKKKKQREEEEEELEEEEGREGDWEKKKKNNSSGPRSFPLDVKELCWQKAEIVKGRDPTRWRRDPVGNLVFRKLVGCSGCLCYDYDHILPYSKVHIHACMHASIWL